MTSSRYIVGIDLGTTNCVVAYVDDPEAFRAQLAAHDLAVLPVELEDPDA